MLVTTRLSKSKSLDSCDPTAVCPSLVPCAVQVSADKKLKKAALDNALVTLADPSKAAKVDPVSEVFAQYWKQKAIDTEKNKNKVRTIAVV